MSERRQQAWDEAQRRYPPGDRQAGFVAGAAWADANPKPHTITRDEFDEACVELDNEQGWACLGDLIYAVCAALGIEVEDDDE